MTKRHPWLLVVGLTLTWLLLAERATFAQLLLGVAVSALMVYGFRAVRPVHPRLRRPASALRLLGRVAVEIIRSNYHVARIVLGLTGGRKVTSGFVDIPLRLRDPHGLATLAAIVTSTPGTVWAGLSEDGAVLTLHLLDLTDDEFIRNLISERYERLLVEIFE
jgi:multicomponent K+:H+ antiporter subunit E